MEVMGPVSVSSDDTEEHSLAPEDPRVVIVSSPLPKQQR